MKELRRIKIDEGTMGYLLCLHSEREGLRVLNCQLIRAGDNRGEGYERYLAQYKDACTAWDVAYQELVKELAGDWVGPGYASEISFLTGELVVYEGGEKSCCG